MAELLCRNWQCPLKAKCYRYITMLRTAGTGNLTNAEFGEYDHKVKRCKGFKEIN